MDSNCLTAFLIIERDKDRRVDAVRKALEGLEVFMKTYHDDGGCDEGSSYWGRAGASLFDCLELLYWASGGKLSFYDLPLVRQIGRFIYRAHIHDDYFINFADGGKGHSCFPGIQVWDRIGDRKLMDLGISAHQLQEEKHQNCREEKLLLLCCVNCPRSLLTRN